MEARSLNPFDASRIFPSPVSDHIFFFIKPTISKLLTRKHYRDRRLKFPCLVRQYIKDVVDIWTSNVEQLDFVQSVDWCSFESLRDSDDPPDLGYLDRFIGTSYEGIPPMLRSEETKAEWIDSMRKALYVRLVETEHSLPACFEFYFPEQWVRNQPWRFYLTLKRRHKMDDDKKELLFKACLAFYLKCSQVKRVYKNRHVTFKVSSDFHINGNDSADVDSIFYNVGEVDTNETAFPCSQPRMPKNHVPQDGLHLTEREMKEIKEERNRLGNGYFYNPQQHRLLHPEDFINVYK